MIIKANLLFILFLMYLSTYGQEQIKFKKLRECNEQLYLKKEPLNGYYSIMHYRWSTEVSTFIDGKREGSVSWFNNGSLEKTTNYRNGVKEGEEITYYYYMSGEIEKVLNYKNDLLNGWQLTYSPSKQLKSKILYENGEKGHSINFFVDGNIQEECSFNNGDGVCAKFYSNNYTNSNSEVKIIDSLFYKDERIVNMKTYVNGILDFEIKVKYEKDSIARFSDEILTISFYKLKTFKKAYVFHIDVISINYAGNILVDLIINSYKSSCQPKTNEIINSYIEPCKLVLDQNTLFELMISHFYVINEKSLYEVDHFAGLDGSDGADDIMPTCDLDLILNNICNDD